jgi:phosphoribosylcarboxyaminoimidazole (NCAIR) mutase
VAKTLKYIDYVLADSQHWAEGTGVAVRDIGMRDVLEALAAGECSVREAEARLAGYATGEAATIAGEMGATVERVADLGVAGLHRLLDALPTLREADVLVVAAGREGALPTVFAGLVDTPVIGLPVSTGYGHGGDGEATLLGMVQSCTVLTVVNVDAGFVAGAQAGLIARAIDAARTGE